MGSIIATSHRIDKKPCLQIYCKLCRYLLSLLTRKSQNLKLLSQIVFELLTKNTDVRDACHCMYTLFRQALAECMLCRLVQDLPHFLTNIYYVRILILIIATNNPADFVMLM